VPNAIKRRASIALKARARWVFRVPHCSVLSTISRQTARCWRATSVRSDYAQSLYYAANRWAVAYIDHARPPGNCACTQSIRPSISTVCLGSSSSPSSSPRAQGPIDAEAHGVLHRKLMAEAVRAGALQDCSSTSRSSAERRHDELRRDVIER